MAELRCIRGDVALKPCPFCGSADIQLFGPTEGVNCRGCHAQVFGAGTESDIATWNRRVTPTEKE
jgi:hypothetical protein